MASEDKPSRGTTPCTPKKAKPPGAQPRADKEPEWTRGLRDLYDKVVDEPLPSSFSDLLDKLDKPSK